MCVFVCMYVCVCVCVCMYVHAHIILICVYVHCHYWFAWTIISIIHYHYCLIIALTIITVIFFFFNPVCTKATTVQSEPWHTPQLAQPSFLAVKTSELASGTEKPPQTEGMDMAVRQRHCKERFHWSLSCWQLNASVWMVFVRSVSIGRQISSLFVGEWWWSSHCECFANCHE